MVALGIVSLGITIGTVTLVPPHFPLHDLGEVGGGQCCGVTTGSWRGPAMPPAYHAQPFAGASSLTESVCTKGSDKCQTPRRGLGITVTLLRTLSGVLVTDGGVSPGSPPPPLLQPQDLAHKAHASLLPCCSSVPCLGSSAMCAPAPEAPRSSLSTCLLPYLVAFFRL